jgi:hypothetical protein
MWKFANVEMWEWNVGIPVQFVIGIREQVQQ